MNWLIFIPALVLYLCAARTMFRIFWAMNVCKDGDELVMDLLLGLVLAPFGLVIWVRDLFQLIFPSNPQISWRNIGEGIAGRGVVTRIEEKRQHRQHRLDPYNLHEDDL